MYETNRRDMGGGGWCCNSGGQIGATWGCWCRKNGGQTSATRAGGAVFFENGG